jgi:ribonuclease HIII
VNEAPVNGVPYSLKRFLDALGAEISFSRHIDYGTQYRVTRGPDTATVNVYTSGKTSTGGKPSPLLALLEDWRLTQAATEKRSSDPTRSAGTEPDGTPRVGTDEAGKGDYFGPLVVAGVRILGEKEARKLQEIGARDSKTLSVLGATNLARGILDSVGQENTRVVVLDPREYEARRRAVGNNVNKLLAEVNVQIFDELKAQVELFVVDEFAKAAHSYIAPRLPPGVRLVVRPRAEDDVAVAAASVLARARYLEEMDALSAKVGFELPRGATHVLGAARRVVEERGPEGLAEVAKVHFGTTAQVLEAPRGPASEEEL